MKKISLIVLAMLFIVVAKTQTISEYAMYDQNLMFVNPAFSGINEGLTAHLGHKNQWIGFKEAPQDFYFSSQFQLNKNMGVGVLLNQQRMGLLNISNVDLNYAYRLNIATNHKLMFGISLNFFNNKIKSLDLDAYEFADVTVTSNNFEESLIANGFGLVYNWKDLNVSISLPFLFSSQEAKVFQYLNSYLSYDFYVGNNKWKLTPSAYLKYQQTSPLQADINFKALWNKYLWLQTSYKTNNDLVFAGGILVKNIGIGYAYELNLAPMSYVSNGSHEIVIFFRTKF